MTTETAAGAQAQKSRESTDNSWALPLVVLVAGMFMSVLDVTIVNVAVPSIATDLGASIDDTLWIATAYTLTLGVVVPLSSWLGDRFGLTQVYLATLLGFGACSALCGLAWDLHSLIGFRVLQAISGGILPVITMTILYRTVPRDRIGVAMGMYGLGVVVAPAVGPVLGGWLIEHFDWRLVFFINVPVGVVVIGLARRFLPETPPTGRHRLDVVGSLVLGLATFCVLFGAVQTESSGPVVLWLGVPALGLLALFYRRERRLTEQGLDPLVDLRLFRRPSYTSGVVLALLFFPAMAGLPLVMALYFQRGLGYSALASALGVTAYAVGNAVAAPLAGRVVDRLGRALVVGAALTFGAGAVGLALVARSVPTAHATLAMAGPLFVMGLGAGGLITPNQALTLMDVDPVVGSTAGGVLQTAQRIGLAVGQAVIGAVFFASIDGPGADSYAHALVAAVLVALCFVTASVAVGVRDLMRGRRARR
jgi:EmrB/QacA subfamily drug resistance transporter